MLRLRFYFIFLGFLCGRLEKKNGIVYGNRQWKIIDNMLFQTI